LNQVVSSNGAIKENVKLDHHQILDPVGGSLALSALVAAVPLILLLVLLGVVRMRSHLAAAWTLLAAGLIAVLAFKLPVLTTVSGALEGAAFGFFPIVWIMLNAVWINRLIQQSGHMRWIRYTFMRVSSDSRVQALVIAFCFGSLLEAMAGFGAPIVVVAAILLGLGFSPIRAATVAMFADAAGTAFGSVGNPIFALSKATGLPTFELGQMVGRQSSIVALFVPFLLILVLDGSRGLKQLWPVGLAIGLGFGVGQVVTSNFIAFQLADLVGALVASLAAVLLLRFWKPVTPEDMANQSFQEGGRVMEATPTTGSVVGSRGGLPATAHLLTPERGGFGTHIDPTDVPTRGQLIRAFAPYTILTVLLALVSIDGPFSTWAGSFFVKFQWPGIGKVIGNDGKPLTLDIFSINYLAATGSILLITGVISAAVLNVAPRIATKEYGRGLAQIKFAALTVMLVLAIAYIFNYSGQAVTIGVFLAGTGSAFIALSPVLGWLGVAATGSDTSANALFGAVQVASAHRTGFSPYLFAAANSEAGALGKLISPQNLAMAAAAVGLSGQEGTLLRRTFVWSLVYLVLFIAVLFLMAVGPLQFLVVH
jgi:lactate permease